ncbi:MAG: minor capsid protein [Burkholderiales bacterium]
MTFLEDLKAFLTANGCDNVYRETMPDKPDECIGLFLYAHAMPTISNGSSTRYVQIQVRRMDGDDAYAVAYEILQMLDSGLDEADISLTEQRKAIARPTAGPRKLHTDLSGRTVYYIEVALFSDDEP